MNWIATLGPVGYMRPAPGTWGSAASVLLALPLLYTYSIALFTLATIAACIIGYISVKAMTAGEADPDHSEIVIDELAGQWIALMPVAYGVWFTGASPLALYPGLLTAFIAFRVFDIWKPSIIGKADARKDAWGVMLDDIWAGIFAAGVVAILAILAHLPVIL